ncbi:hypothetical protein SLEP1_g45511 [Rubroshorea leprosula]|uniref:Uncharacterized protein n=1 Tax=Rubroshorea leprosula TaxID=152421 RepID=A0AAV5LK15_9ROSI|nr:hypothetical protein SLEP1_g45511 [Rubroshorea leprosula]
MGKRKERRLAALSNAGRRVKLDLFAEPSEDLGGSQDDRDANHEPALPLQPLPNSPSSSSSSGGFPQFSSKGLCM